MRIIAGQYRGLALANLGKGDAGAHLRPTSDRVRESLFSMLMAYGVPDGCRVLDLFAGTGALGLEALSRGATHATFVDDGRKALSLIKQNIGVTRSADSTRVLARDATRLPVCADDAFDLVFLDPPYGKSMGQKALEVAVSGGWLAEDALVVWEESAPMMAPAGFAQEDSRKYGDTYVTILSRTD